MKDELIEFETAKLAKEKGFNNAVKGMPRYEPDGTISASGFWDYNLAAPTQSLLQRWLREVHGIDVDVWCNASGWGVDLNKTNGTCIKGHVLDNVETDSGMFETYEEALEAGLLEALKLIKV